MNKRSLCLLIFIAFSVLAGPFLNSASASVITFTNKVNSHFFGSRDGQLNFEWDTDTNTFVSGLFKRGTGDYMSGDYNLDVADQIWYQNQSIYPDRRVNLLDAPSSTGTLADALAAIATFTVGQTVSYGVNVVNPPGGVNEMWATPGVVEVSGVVSTATAVPEPSSLAVLGVGIAGLVTCRRRKRKQTA